MESTLTGQNVAMGAPSPEISETKNSSPVKKTESPSSQDSGAILKTVAKTRSGGVKLGSFILGGRKKTNSEEDSSLEVKEVKRKSKKGKKEKTDDSDKQESEGSATSTPSPGTKQSVPSKASLFVRKFSIGKYKASGSAKALKSPDTPSSQEEYQSVSPEEECFATASPLSAETNGHPSLEVSATPTQEATGPVDQRTISKVSKSDSSIADPFTPTTPGIMDSLPKLESTSQGETAEIVKGEEESMIVSEVFLPTFATDSDVENLPEIPTYPYEWGQSEDFPLLNSNGDIILPTHHCKPVDLSPVCTIPPFAEEGTFSKHKLRFTQCNGDGEQDADKKHTTKHQTPPLTPLQAKLNIEVEEYFKQLKSDPLKLERPGRPLPGIRGCVRGLESDEERLPRMRSRSEESDVLSAFKFYRMKMRAQKVGEKHEHLYKILVIGELGTGKTSIIKRYVHQFFSQHYRATIGVDFALKVLNWDANTIVRLQLWDIAGQERFGNMTRVYYKEAVGAFIVFDVTRAATFDAVVKWKQDLDSKVQLPDGSAIPCVLLANKCDQQKEGLVNNPTKMDEYCKERGFTAWFETSAKENINIEDAAKCLVSKILQNDKMINSNESSNDLERFSLDGRNQRDQQSKTCGC